MISVAFGAFFAGGSLRRVADMMHQCFDVPFRAQSILAWIDAYVPIVSRFLRSVPVESGDIWQFMGKKISINKAPSVLWVIMEKKGRFILVAYVGSLTVESAVAALNIAKHQSSTVPRMIETDEWPEHGRAIRAVFEDKVIHSPPPDPALGFIHVNKLNAVAGHLYRPKLTDAYKTAVGAQNVIEGLTICHNYVWPADDLDGKTPAEVLNARVSLSGNRWLLLIKQATESEASHAPAA
jgi:transposase-like protein